MWHIYGPFTVSARAIKNNPLRSTTCRLSAICIREELLLQLYLILYNLRMCECTVSWNTKFILPSLGITDIHRTKNPIKQNYSLNLICPITILTLVPFSGKSLQSHNITILAFILTFSCLLHVLCTYHHRSHMQKHDTREPYK